MEFISAAYIFGIPPELAFLSCDRLDTGYLGDSHTFWDNPVLLREGSESGFCFPVFLHASVVVILQRQLRIHLDSQPVCCFNVESYKAATDSDLCCQHSRAVLLVASSTCERCHIRFCCFKLQPHSARPLNAFVSAFFTFRDHLMNHAASRYPAKVIHEGQSFGSNVLLDPVNQL